MKRKNETKEQYNRRMRPYNRGRYRDNPSAYAVISRKYRMAHPEKARAISMHQGWKTKGIKKQDGSQFTVDDYDVMFAHQCGRCAICSRHQSELRYALCVDHDHTTGAIRGLLCLGCNTRLAVLEDKQFIGNARRYLGA